MTITTLAATFRPKLIAGLIAVLLLGSVFGYVYYLRGVNDELGLKLSAETAKRQSLEVTLTDIELQRVKLEGDLVKAQGEAGKVRIKTVERVKEILISPPPATCEDAIKLLRGGQ